MAIDTKKQDNSTTTSQKAKDSTLNFLQVAEIRDRVIILKEGQMRAILACSSTNFALRVFRNKISLLELFKVY
jgi:hypothetical protein